MNRRTVQSIAKHASARRRAATLVELLVAFGLLATVMAVSLPMVVHHSRLLTSARHYRLALDELSNQLDRLTLLGEDDLRSALGRLAPSPFTASHLPGAALEGEVSPAEIGSRLTLRIVWDEPQRAKAPLSLSAWIAPDSTDTDGPPSEDNES